MPGPTCRRYPRPATFAWANDDKTDVDALVGLLATAIRGGDERRVDVSEVILDHYRIRTRGAARSLRRQVHHVNPHRGDEITLRVDIEEMVSRRDIRSKSPWAVRSPRPVRILFDEAEGQPISNTLDEVWRSSKSSSISREGRGKVE